LTAAKQHLPCEFPGGPAAGGSGVAVELGAVAAGGSDVVEGGPDCVGGDGISAGGAGASPAPHQVAFPPEQLPQFDSDNAHQDPGTAQEFG